MSKQQQQELKDQMMEAAGKSADLLMKMLEPRVQQHTEEEEKLVVGKRTRTEQEGPSPKRQKAILKYAEDSQVESFVANWDELTGKEKEIFFAMDGVHGEDFAEGDQEELDPTADDRWKCCGEKKTSRMLAYVSVVRMPQ